MKWFPLQCRSHFSLFAGSASSLLDALSKPEQIAERLAECGLGGAALADHGSLAGVPPFLKAMKSVCSCAHHAKSHDENGKGKCLRKGCSCQKFEKKDLKALAGSEFFICRKPATDKGDDNLRLGRVGVVARGKEGWTRLVRASSSANLPEHFLNKPRLSLEQLAGFAGGQFIVYSGHMGSDLANLCFDQPHLAWTARTYEAARGLVRSDWKEAVNARLGQYLDLFGKDNFRVAIHLLGQENVPALLVVARILRHLAGKMGVPCLATVPVHYPRKEDWGDHRVLLCTALKTTTRSVEQAMSREEDVSLTPFLRSNSFYLPTTDEIAAAHQDHPEELANTLEVASRCESFSVSNPPMLPVFQCPEGHTPDTFLLKLCRDGWQDKIEPMLQRWGKEGARTPGVGSPLHVEKRKEYADRLDMEYRVLTEAGLSSYFLIVWDYIRHARLALKCKVGKGRGSAAGCLVSYLTDITRVDPVRYGLLFSRFYNAGRNTKDHVALPDIDSDFPVGYRDRVIDYCRQKYGEDRVCQMATFARMQGRGALSDVLRVHERCSFEEIKRITQHIPDETRISDQLQEMLEETGEASIIRWALENNPEPLREWCWIDENGELDGPLALDFAQAIRLEGTKRSQGRHPSGVIISSTRLEDVFPMVHDKSTGRMIIGVDMRDGEDMGAVKFDMLALQTLNCIMDAEHVMRYGRLP